MEAEVTSAVTAGNAAAVRGLDQATIGTSLDVVATMIDNLAPGVGRTNGRPATVLPRSATAPWPTGSRQRMLSLGWGTMRM